MPLAMPAKARDAASTRTNDASQRKGGSGCGCRMATNPALDYEGLAMGRLSSYRNRGIIASGGGDLACRITRIPKSRSGL